MRINLIYLDFSFAIQENEAMNTITFNVKTDAKVAFSYIAFSYSRYETGFIKISPIKVIRDIRSVVNRTSKDKLIVIRLQSNICS